MFNPGQNPKSPKKFFFFFFPYFDSIAQYLGAKYTNIPWNTNKHSHSKNIDLSAPYTHCIYKSLHWILSIDP